ACGRAAPVCSRADVALRAWSMLSSAPRSARAGRRWGQPERGRCRSRNGSRSLWLRPVPGEPPSAVLEVALCRASLVVVRRRAVGVAEALLMPLAAKKEVPAALAPAHPVGHDQRI